MIIDRLRKDARFMRVLARAGGCHKAYLIDEVEVDKIRATMIEAAERIEELEARATPALPQGEHDLQDVRCQCCGYMTYHSEHMGCIRSAYKQALPQVPEGMALVPVDCMTTIARDVEYSPHTSRHTPFLKVSFAYDDYDSRDRVYAMLATTKEKGE